MPAQPFLWVFLLASAILAFISRASISRPSSHGFIRFFVWELILAMLYLNAAVWFEEPFSWHQIVSWILLAGSLVPLVLGISALRSHGKVDASKRPESELLGFERTTSLVQQGIFRHVRHPMYSSLLLLAWGVFFKRPTVLTAMLAALATGGVTLMARRDEAECQRVFGESYQRYMERTKRFLPLLF